jgi:hypothetical protein
MRRLVFGMLLAALAVVLSGSVVVADGWPSCC